MPVRRERSPDRRSGREQRYLTSLLETNLSAIDDRVLEEFAVVGNGRVEAIMRAARFLASKGRAGDEQSGFENIGRFAGAPRISGGQALAQQFELGDGFAKILAFANDADVLPHDELNLSDEIFGGGIGGFAGVLIVRSRVSPAGGARHRVSCGFDFTSASVGRIPF